MAEIEFRHVSKIFEKGSAAVKDLNLQIHDQELVMIIGPSGCGKSTTLRMLAGLETATEGSILIDGTDVTKTEPGKRGLSMVFQNYALYPQMNIYNNIAFALKVRGMSKTEVDKRVREVAELMQITPLLKRRPAQVSGGQRQRVAIAAAIAREAKAYLMDEPLSNLDAKLRASMRVEVAKLHNRLHATIVYVTHDQVEAMTLADRIVIMNKGEVQQVAAPNELYRNPVNDFVAGFVGSPQMNFLPVTMVRESGGWTLQADGIRAALPEAIAADVQASSLWEEENRKAGKLVLGLRPEELVLTDKGGEEISMLTQVCENLGAEEFLYGQIGTASDPALQPDVVRQMTTVRASYRTGVKTSDRISLKAAPESWKLFDPDNGKNLCYKAPAEAPEKREARA